MPHTLGPWSVEPASIGFIVRDVRGDMLCRVDRREDAILMARAPEMLEILRQIGDTSEAFNDATSIKIESALDKVDEIARDAREIADKAEGLLG